MASLGQSTPSTRNRDSDLPDPAGEKRQLRRMVQDLTDTIEATCKDLKMIERVARSTAVRSQASTIHDCLQNALDRAEGSPS
jgi:hypothetical protein